MLKALIDELIESEDPGRLFENTNRGPTGGWLVLVGLGGFHMETAPPAITGGLVVRRRPEDVVGERLDKASAASPRVPAPGEESVRPTSLYAPTVRRKLRLGRVVDAGEGSTRLRRDSTHLTVGPAVPSAGPGPLLGLGPEKPRRTGSKTVVSRVKDTKRPFREGSGSPL